MRYATDQVFKPLDPMRPVDTAQAFAIEWIRTQPLAAPTRTFRLEEVQLAHAWLESQQSIGKTALVFDR